MIILILKPFSYSIGSLVTIKLFVARNTNSQAPSLIFIVSSHEYSRVGLIHARVSSNHCQTSSPALKRTHLRDWRMSSNTVFVFKCFANPCSLT